MENYLLNYVVTVVKFQTCQPLSLTFWHINRKQYMTLLVSAKTTCVWHGKVLVKIHEHKITKFNTQLNQKNIILHSPEKRKQNLMEWIWG